MTQWGFYNTIDLFATFQLVKIRNKLHGKNAFTRVLCIIPCAFTTMFERKLSANNYKEVNSVCISRFILKFTDSVESRSISIKKWKPVTLFSANGKHEIHSTTVKLNGYIIYFYVYTKAHTCNVILWKRKLDSFETQTWFCLTWDGIPVRFCNSARGEIQVVITNICDNHERCVYRKPVNVLSTATQWTLTVSRPLMTF